MIWLRRSATVVLFGLVSIGTMADQSAIATEGSAAKPELPAAPVPQPPPSPSVPASAKPRPQDSETKPPAKTTPGPAPDSAGKDAPPVKPEPAPAPPKPKVQDNDVKPPAKAPSQANGSAKPTTVPPLSEITGRDGVPMVLVTAGEFTMGSDKGDDDEAPIHRAHVDAFYIDKFEVTNSRFAKFVEAIQAEPPWGFADKETPLAHADRPVRWVNWMDAMGYCLWMGKRLPTEAEWEKAARGTDGRAYPWGNDAPTPAHAVFGLKEGADMIGPIGNRDKGKSPYGAHDLAGNLYEWVMDWYDENYYANFAKSPAISPRGPETGTAKVQRGGSYINAPYRLRSTFRTKGDPTEHDPNVGFRCAQDIPNSPLAHDRVEPR